MLINIAIVAAATYLTGTWLAGTCAIVLIFVWRMLPRKPGEGPPVLALAMTMQWVETSIGVFYSGITGRPLDAIPKSDYQSMVLIGLGCVAALTVGLRLGDRLAANAIEPQPHDAPDETVRTLTLVLVYGVGVVVTAIMQEVAFQYPTLAQAILALSFARFALIYLLLRRFIRDGRWDFVLLLLAFEVVLGFTGYFSGFKEPMLLAALAMLEAFDTRRKSHWVIGGSLAISLAFACVMWMGVRSEFRQDLDGDLIASSRSERLARMQALVTDWFSQRNERAIEDLDLLVDRAWAIYYPALAVARVPSVLPHTEGELMSATIAHLVTPRILFPDKPDLPSDSEMVRQYSGVYVAGPERNTSIAFGYAAESYIDFGVPLMFLPVLIFGVAMGAAYQWFLRVIIHRELAISLVTCIFWVNLYLFERSWAKTLGFAITMMIYLGLVAFIVDRWLLMRAADQLARSDGSANDPIYGVDH
jgi:hypothetical protein